MNARRLLFILFVSTLFGCSAVVDGQPSSKLPLVRVPAAPDTHGPLMLLLTGDGDWAAFPRGLAAAAAQRGMPVLGLKSRDYMSSVQPTTPERLASDLEGVVRQAMAKWHRQWLIVVGYSRGAGWAPFILNRWPRDLRNRVEALALVGASGRASFEFHLEDLFRDVKRPTDRPVIPELKQLSAIPTVCAYGEKEEDSLCRHPLPGMVVLQHSGGHRVNDNKAFITALLNKLTAMAASARGSNPKPAPPSL